MQLLRIEPNGGIGPTGKPISRVKGIVETSEEIAMASKPPPEKAPKTANEPTNKNMNKLVNDPDFGSMKNTSGTGTAEPKKSN